MNLPAVVALYKQFAVVAAVPVLMERPIQSVVDSAVVADNTAE